jgi:hypothetical protein
MLASIEWGLRRVLAIFFGLAVGVSMVILEALSRRSTDRLNASLVREKLPAERCAKCVGALGPWDGRFHQGNVHFYEGGYLRKIKVQCHACHAEQVFYFKLKGVLTNQGKVRCEAVLMNRDKFFSGLSPKDLEKL